MSFATFQEILYVENQLSRSMTATLRMRYQCRNFRVFLRVMGVFKLTHSVKNR